MAEGSASPSLPRGFANRATFPSGKLIEESPIPKVDLAFVTAHFFALLWDGRGERFYKTLGESPVVAEVPPLILVLREEVDFHHRPCSFLARHRSLWSG